MFDFVRRHTKLIMLVLFLLVIPSFALFGIEGYTRFNDGAGKVAEVNGNKITQSEWDQAHQQEVNRLRVANPNVDLRLLDSPRMKYATLERLVRERVLAAAAADEHLVTSDQRLASELQRDPAIAALRRADGSLDLEQYRALLAAQNLTPEGYEARVRADMSMRQVLGGVVDSTLISTAQGNVAMDAFLERREARVKRFLPADYASKIQPTDAELETYLKAHVASYQTPESARIEYLSLDLDSVKKGIAVSEQDLRTYYDQNAAALGTPEERRASHILITAPKDAPAEERAKAKAKAEQLLAELRKAPDTFADVARKFSQDDASARDGGDLGYFQRGKGIDPTISKVTYALGKVGDISDVAESEFGYHIVRLTDLKPAIVPPFEQLRAKLEDQLRTQQAQKQLLEMAEVFTNGVYEQPDSLKPVADKLKLPIQTADNVQRVPRPGATGALANAKFLTALFSADSLEKKRNTEATDLGGNQLVSGRVVAYKPASTKPLAEVRDEVRKAYIAQRGAEMARQEGQAQLKTWTDKPDSATGLPAAVVLSRDAMQNEPPKLVEAVLRADPAKLPVFVGVDLGADGFAVARVDKVLGKVEAAADVLAQGRQRYDQSWTLSEAVQYYEALRARYKARIFAPAPPVDISVGGPEAATAR